MIQTLVVFFLDCFRFQVCGNEYNVLLNKRDIDLYHYEIWKKMAII